MGSLALNEVHQLDGSLVLIANGIVDDATVECFERGLDRAMGAGSRQVIVDLTTCRLDSAGLAALVRLRRRSGSRSAATSLVASDGAPFRMLQIIGLTSQFPTYPTVEAALSSPPAAPSLVAWRRGALAMRSRPSRHAGTRGDGKGWPRRTPPSTSLDGAVLPLRASQ
ncbi:MAG TPA: STAS domain-containing protein [Gaiellaceae bacterium]|nr:STAS domain-containing protein [Gaiellaceae bacterium]